jgi:YggT family protein
MLIIERTLWFVNMAINVVIIAVIALMIVRLIADAMDLNPFTWTARTIRRLTDGFVIPVRGSLRQLGFDPKFAPLVVILVVIVLGLFVGWLAASIGDTISGVLQSVQHGAVITAVGHVISGLLSIYLILIIARVIFSWAQLSYRNRVMRFLIDTTEPLLGPLRRRLPPLGPFDISPIVAMVIIWFLLAAVAGTLLRGSTVTF